MFKCNVNVSMYRQEKAEENRNKTNRKRQLCTLKTRPLKRVRQGGLSAWRPKLACVQIWLLIKTGDFLEGQVSWFGNVEM